MNKFSTCRKALLQVTVLTKGNISSQAIFEKCIKFFLTVGKLNEILIETCFNPDLTKFCIVELLPLPPSQAVIENYYLRTTENFNKRMMGITAMKEYWPTL